MIRLSAYLVAAATLAGCASDTVLQSTPPVIPGCQVWEQQARTPEMAAVHLLTADLGKIIGVHEVAASRTPSGLPAIRASIYNCTDTDLALIVRTRFAGDQGETEPPSAWKPVFLPPRGEVAYAESAVSDRTRRLSIDIHDANRGQSQFAPGQSYEVPAR